MKKYLFLAATLLLTLSMSVSAQNYNNRRNTGNRRNNMNYSRSEQMMRMTPQERVDLMTKELNLTTKEASEVLALCEKHETERIEEVNKHRSERGTGYANRDARRDEFREMRAEQMEKQFAELEKIIGKERAEKWNELRQDVRDSNREGRYDGRGYNRNSRRDVNNRGNFDNRRSDYMMRLSAQERVDLMTKELDLTSEQAAQILALTQKYEDQRNQEVDEHREERRTERLNRDARRDEFREMRTKQMEEQQAELEKIIGKEKLDKWNSMRQDVRDTNRAGRRNPGYRNR
ncbi:MAG TPA: hypothetical protein GX746_07125 [Bacteroidales bacterium]|nr:hypothetical protein [Bacteroidales bacterium]